MKNLYILFFAIMLLSSCTESLKTQENTISKEDNIAQFTAAMRAHLDAVEQKDTIAMKKTMAPDGKLYFLQPQRELSTTSSSFMDFHKGWFKGATTPWSIAFKIIETEVQDSLGIAVVECLYQEPDRDGKPYYNKLHVTYVQKRIQGKWYVILDQATSIEKSTD